ncbi:hypothetical protein [Thermococcus sp.]
MAVSEVLVRPVFLEEAIEEACADGNEWFLRVEFFPPERFFELRRKILEIWIEQVEKKRRVKNE